MQVCTPSYIDKYQSGLIEKRIDKLLSILNSCTLCPHECRVNRLNEEKGICQAGDSVSISSAFPHFGEEPPLVGRRGSGTIFFANCNLRCVFCQNHDISHRVNGTEVTQERLAELMLYLQGVGCLNINFVTPTHYASQIVQALPLAIKMGLNVPLVWNCSGYDSLEVIKLLDGIVDIYMPDVKFGDLENARRFTTGWQGHNQRGYCPDTQQKLCQKNKVTQVSNTAHNYFENVKPVLKEMYRQVGNLELDDNGIAVKGLLVRHLVMPKNRAGSKKILKFIAEEVSQDTYINLMGQYRPAFQAFKYPDINRNITTEEYNEVLLYAREVGLYRGF